MISVQGLTKRYGRTLAVDTAVLPGAGTWLLARRDA
jgi:hypothetical protein